MKTKLKCILNFLLTVQENKEGGGVDILQNVHLLLKTVLSMCKISFPWKCPPPLTQYLNFTLEFPLSLFHAYLHNTMHYKHCIYLYSTSFSFSNLLTTLLYFHALFSLSLLECPWFFIIYFYVDTYGKLGYSQRMRL